MYVLWDHDQTSAGYVLALEVLITSRHPRNPRLR